MSMYGRGAKRRADGEEAHKASSPRPDTDADASACGDDYAGADTDVEDDAAVVATATVSLSGPSNTSVFVTIYVTKVVGSGAAVTYDTHDCVLDVTVTRARMETAFAHWTPAFILYMLDEMVRFATRVSGGSPLRFHYTNGAFVATHKETAVTCGFDVLPAPLSTLLRQLIASPFVFNGAGGNVEMRRTLHMTLEVLDTQ